MPCRKAETRFAAIAALLFLLVLLWWFQGTSWPDLLDKNSRAHQPQRFTPVLVREEQVVGGFDRWMQTTSLSFTPDSRSLVIGLAGGFCWLSIVPSLEHSNKCIMGNQLTPAVVAFSTKQNLLALGTGDHSRNPDLYGRGELLLVDWKRQKQVAALSQHRAVWDAAFSPDGCTLVTRSEEEPIKIWDVASRRVREVIPFAPNATGRAVLLHPEQEVIAYDNGTGIQLLNWVTREEAVIPASTWAPEKNEQIWMLAGTGSVLVAAYKEELAIKLFDVRQRSLQLYLPLEQMPDVLALSRNGKFLALGQHEGVIRFYDLDKGQQFAEIPVASKLPPPRWPDEREIQYTYKLRRMDFSPDGKWLAVGLGNIGNNPCAVVQVWKLEPLLSP